MEQDDDPALHELTVRACEYCGAPVPKRRKDARFCSTSHRVMASRQRKRQAAIRQSLVARGGEEFTDHSRRADMYDVGLDDDHGSERALYERAVRYEPEWAEADARFHAMVSGDTQEGPRAGGSPLDAWRRWRAAARRNPGVEPQEQTADRVARHKAAEDARKARRDAGTAGRVQDRFDPRTAPNVARNANASRTLNVRHVETPPAWATQDFDFRNETTDGGPYRGGRPAGQRSRHADFAWNMRDGFF